jgi:O-antigen/teichoic acid export membrane protein
MAIAQCIGIAAELVAVPLALGYLGTERYGLWLTISSLIAILGFADFGLGYGVVNAVSEAHGRGDRRAAVTAVSSATVLLTIIGIFFATGFAITYPHIPWQRIFNVSSPTAIAEVGPVVALFLGYFAISIVLGVVQRVQAGYQVGYISSLWTGIGSLLGIGGLLLAIQAQAGLPWIALALLGAPMLATLLNGLTFFGFHSPWLRPRLSDVHTKSMRNLARLGSLFFVLQLSGALAYQSDSLIVAQILGAERVPQFAVPMRMFLFIPTIIGFVLMPLWPAYAEAIVRGDIRWVKQTLWRSLILAFAVSLPLAIGLIALGRTIVQRWIGDAVAPSMLLLVALGIWAVLCSAGGSLAMLLNGASVIKFQILCAPAMVITNVALSILLTRAIGESGVVWGSIIAQLACITTPTIIFLPRLLKRIGTPSPDHTLHRAS